MAHAVRKPLTDPKLLGVPLASATQIVFLQAKPVDHVLKSGIENGNENVFVGPRYERRIHGSKTRGFLPHLPATPSTTETQRPGLRHSP